MQLQSFRQRLLASTIVAGAVIGAAPAFAQDATSAPAAAQDTGPGGSPTLPTTQPSAGPIEGQNPATTPQVASSADEQGEIIVTGSRIPQPNLNSASPITVLNSQEVKLSGTTRVEDLLNSLPQVFAGQTGTISNGSTGTATVDLRGLGPERTLVLINGRRLVPGDPAVPTPDINFIPDALIKRVDVLTGGASSVYGADAVSGVVNFVMDTDYSGFKLDGQYSLYQHNNNDNAYGVQDAINARGFPFPTGNTLDGRQIDATAIIGAGFDDNRGHVTAYAGYRKIAALTQDARDYSACVLQTKAAGGTSCGGSATSNVATVIAYTGGTAGDVFTDPVTKVSRPVPYSEGTSTYFHVGPNRTLPGSFIPYNFAPTNYYQRPDTRYTAGFFAHYDVSDAFKPYMEGMFMDDRSVAQIAASGDFGNTFSINCNNPLLSAAQLAVICDPGNLISYTVSPIDGSLSAPSANNAAAVSTVTGNAKNGIITAPYTFTDPTTGQTYQKGFAQILRRNVEGGGRQDDLQHTDFRIVTGAKGDIAKGISYDAYYQYARTDFSETYYNDFSVTRLARALDVVRGPGGTVECRSVLDGSDPNCVPYNIFADGGVTQGAINYLQTPGFQRGRNTEAVASGNITALLGEYGLQSPLATDGVALNLGAEYRRETLTLNTDEEFQTGDLAGQGAATLPVHGAYTVREGFGELRVPLVHDNFIYDASVSGGYRYSRYTIGANHNSTDTYKVEGNIAPVRDINFRASYNRAVRSPNIQELFAPQHVVLDGSEDPCAGANPDFTAAQCALTGVTATQYGSITPNPAGQYNGLVGGQPTLKPEKADSITAGAVFQPRFLPGFALSADYFHIKIKNTVESIGADTILETCGTTGDPTFCGLIHRDQFGSLWRTPDGYTVDVTQNLGSLKTDGIDVNGSYQRSLGNLGSVGVSLVGTYLLSLTTNNGVSDPYNCAGYYGLQCGTPNPKWRHKARLTYTAPDGIGVSVQWRHFDKVNIDRSSDNATLTGTYSPTLFELKQQNYIDLTVTAAFAKHATLRFGVNNIFDKIPPINVGNGTSGVTSGCAAVSCNGNTYPAVYDALGRYLFAGVTLDF